MGTIFWDALSKKERIMGVALIILTVVLIYLIMNLTDEKKTSDMPDFIDHKQVTPLEEGREQRKDKLQKPGFFMVDVKGAVQSPGVYKMETGMRVDDVIKTAGGLLEKADPNAINLAQLLQDEMVIYVPEKGEDAPIQSSSSEGSGKVNINKADANELQSIPGIGPSKAEAIITYREENGSFKSIEDLTNVPGIGDKTLDQMSERITTSN